jgi:hypothetical protein
MLQRLLLITLTLCSLSASAQWQQTGSKVRYVNGLGIPTKDTAAGVSADSSQILIRPADSSLYIKYKRTWVKVGAGGGGTIGGSGTTNRVPKFTASTTLGNSSIVDSASAVAMTINASGNIGVGTTNASNKFVVSNAGLSGFEVAPTGGVSSGVLLQAYNRNTLAYMAQSYYALGHTWNVGTAAATRAMDIASGGAVLINTTTDNGVDKLQVNGSMNVSTLATAQNLSVTNNATISNKLAIRTTTQTANLTVLGGYSIGGSIPTDWNFMSAGRAGVVSSNKGFYFDIIGGSYAEFSTFDWGTSQPYNMVFQGNGGRLLVATTTDNTVDRLQVNGSISGIGMKQAYVTKTGAYTATNDDYVIDCTSGTFTVTLPASSGRTGRILIIKNSGAGTITVDGNASETIDGAATYAISVQYGTIQIMSDGTNWKIISKF